MNAKKINTGIIIAYFIGITVIYPFYAPGGYLRIGEVKYEFFRNVSLAALAAVGGVILLSALLSRDREWIVKHYRQMSITDWSAYGYCLAAMVSYLCSAYKEDALWGAEGWYMGAITQIIFVLLYFFFSRYFNFGGREGAGEASPDAFVQKCLGLWLLAAAGVFLLGICNRYSVYPVMMEGQTETFISTLGNINWFCGYWSVSAPLGIVLYWCSDKGVVRILSGIYSFIAVLSGITQGSSSAYLVFIALFITLFCLSLHGNQKLYRFLELCMLFAVTCQVGRALQYVPGLSYNYWGSQTGISALLLTGNGTVWILILVLFCYVIFHILERHGRFHIERHKRLWGIMTAVVVTGVCAVVFLFMVDSEIIRFREVPGSVERDGYLEMVIDEDWGNGRGAAWNCGMGAYRSMDSIHKAFGIGPDCFADYIYDVPDLAERAADSFGNQRLTNAHNEWLTILVNTGAAGLLCYAVFFVTAFVRFLRKAGDQPLLYVCAAAVLAYMYVRLRCLLIPRIISSAFSRF